MKINAGMPWRPRLYLGVLLLIGVCCVGVAYAQLEKARSATGAIEPAADELLHKMSDKLTNAGQFTVTGRRTMDPAAQGRPVNLDITFELSLQRPNKLIARMEGKGSKRTFVYDGAQATLYDETIDAYASVDSGGVIDAMLDGLHDKYGFTPPLTDFLVQDPYRDLTRNAQSGRVIGREAVGGEECHHLSFTQEDADWELWLSTQDLLPRRFVMIQKNMPERPRLEAVFTKWNLAPQLNAGAFAFKPPQNAEKIEMIPLPSGDTADQNTQPERGK